MTGLHHLAVCCATSALLVLNTGCTTLTPTRAAAEEPGVRVATYNLNYGLSADAVGLEAVRATGADVIVFQEVTAGWARALRALGKKGGLPHCRFTPDTAAGGLGVCAAFPITTYDIIDNPISWFPAARVVVDTPQGPLQVLNVHLRPPFSDQGMWHGIFGTPAIRHDELELFMVFVDEDLPTVVAGDFNEWSGEALDLLDDRGFASVARLFHEDEETHTWRWPVPVLGEVTQTLDHLFVDDRWAVRDAWVVHQGRSDHYPVVADLSPRR